MEAPFGRLGGKSRIANELINNFPPLYQHTKYIENRKKVELYITNYDVK